MRSKSDYSRGSKIISKKPDSTYKPLGNFGKQSAKPKEKFTDPGIIYPVIIPSPDMSYSSIAINEQIKQIFGYEFRGYKLFNINNSAGYIFSSDYDSLGTFVNLYIQCLMKEEAGLQEIWILPGAFPNINIFTSQDFLINDSKLLVIIQGRGEVRAGQWSRKICINENIQDGSNLPYIHQALLLGYSIIVLNPNYNKDYNYT